MGGAPTKEQEVGPRSESLTQLPVAPTLLETRSLDRDERPKHDCGGGSPSAGY